MYRVRSIKYRVKVVLLLLFIASTAFAQDITIDEVRKKYPLATKDEAACSELYNALKDKAKGSNLIAGYAGGVTMMMAKYTSNPFSKLSYFNEGKDLLESAIEKNKNDIELRFLRFAIQENLPGMLNYNDNLEEDKNYIMKYLVLLEKSELKKAIATYMIKSERTSENEKTVLRKYEK